MLSDEEKKEKARQRTRAWYAKNKAQAKARQKKYNLKHRKLSTKQTGYRFGKQELEDIRIARESAGLPPLKEHDLRS